MSDEKTASTISTSQLEDRLLQAIDFLRQAEIKLRDRIKLLKDKTVSLHDKVDLLNNYWDKRASTDESGKKMQTIIDASKSNPPENNIAIAINKFQEENKLFKDWIDKLKKVLRKVHKPDFASVRYHIDDVYDDISIRYHCYLISGVSPKTDEMLAFSKSMDVLKNCCNHEIHANYRGIFDKFIKGKHGFGGGLNNFINALVLTIDDNLHNHLGEAHPSFKAFLEKSNNLSKKCESITEEAKEVVNKMANLGGNIPSFLAKIRYNMQVSAIAAAEKKTTISLINTLLGYRDLSAEVQATVRENENKAKKEHNEETSPSQQSGQVISSLMRHSMLSPAHVQAAAASSDARVESAQEPNPGATIN